MKSPFPIYKRDNKNFVCILSDQDFVSIQLLEDMSVTMCGKNNELVIEALFDERFVTVERQIFIEAIIKANDHFKQYAILENQLKPLPC